MNMKQIISLHDALEKAEAALKAINTGQASVDLVMKWEGADRREWETLRLSDAAALDLREHVARMVLERREALAMTLRQAADDLES